MYWFIILGIIILIGLIIIIVFNVIDTDLYADIIHIAGVCVSVSFIMSIIFAVICMGNGADYSDIVALSHSTDVEDIKEYNRGVLKMKASKDYLGGFSFYSDKIYDLELIEIEEEK